METLTVLSCLPAFASADNLALNSELERLARQLDDADHELLDHTDTIAVLSEHTQKGLKEVNLASKVLTDRSRQFSVQEHVHQLQLRRLEALSREVQELQREEREAAERLEHLELDKARKLQLVNAFKEAQSWSETQLQQWSALAAQKEEDNLALQAYSRQDEGLIKQLNADLGRLALEVSQAEVEGSKAHTNRQAAEAESTAAAENVRQLLQERDGFSKQYEEALQKIDRQDASLLLAKAALGEHRGRMKSKSTEGKGQLKLLQEENDCLRQVESETSRAGRAAEKGQAALAKSRDQVQALADSINLLGTEVAQVEHECGQLQGANNGVRSEEEELKRESRKLESEARSLDSLLKREGGKQRSLEGSAKELNALHLAERQRLEQAAKDFAAAAAGKAKEELALHDLSRTSRALGSALSSAKAQQKHSHQRLKQLDEQALQQEEVLYKARFRLVALQRQAEQAAGHHSQAESAALQASIDGLEKDLEAARSDCVTLSAHAQKALEELDRRRKQQAEHAAEEAALKSSITELQTVGDNCERRAAAVAKDKEARLVERDVAEVEVQKRRGQALSAAADTIALRDGKEAAETQLQARLLLMQADKEGLLAELRLAKLEVRRIQREATDCLRLRRRLEAKHATLCLKRSTALANASQAETTIRATEEVALLRKAEAQQEGGLRTARLDVVALEQALTQAKAANLDCQHRVRSQPSRTAEKVQSEEDFDASLREEVALAGERLARLVKKKEAMDGARAASVEAADTLANDVRAAQAALDEINARKAELETWSEGQKQKAERALKRSAIMDGDTPLQRDAKLALLQETNRKVAKEVWALVRKAEGDILRQAAKALHAGNLPQESEADCTRPDETCQGLIRTC